MDSSHDIVNLSYPDIAKDVKVGDDILFDDGELDMKVIDIVGPTIVAQVLNDGVLGAHKSVNVPGEHIALPALTEKDYQNILLAIEEDIDFIAHSLCALQTMSLPFRRFWTSITATSRLYQR